MYVKDGTYAPSSRQLILLITCCRLGINFIKDYSVITLNENFHNLKKF